MIKRSVISLAHSAGFDIRRYKPMADEAYPKDLTPEQIAIIRVVKPYTMTGVERLVGLIEAVRYIVKNDIPGDIVECGVWKGGSMMAAALTLLSLGCQNRQLYLFDTFAGMSTPTDLDVDNKGRKAEARYNQVEKLEDGSDWCYSPLDEVKQALYSTGYKAENIHFIKGKVEDTLPEQAPATIALLRLDTDWYESTKHELIHLFPRLVQRGVLIIDDYGHWAGARQATDEYFTENNLQLLFNRLDYSGRLVMKV